jgi:hypothetical protein
VVAVFVAGPEWQFRGWPEIAAGKRPVDIFAKCQSVLFMCISPLTLCNPRQSLPRLLQGRQAARERQDMGLPPAGGLSWYLWNTTLHFDLTHPAPPQLNKTSRHFDAMVVFQFWDILDKFNRAHNPTLRI